MQSSPNRIHNETSFYKYVTSSTAKIILQSGTLRWSSPVEFNDPFDVPRVLMHGVEPHEIKKEVNNYFAELISNPPSKTDHLHPQIKFIIDSVKSFNSKEFNNECLKAIGQEKKEEGMISCSLDPLKKLWLRLVPNLRILCLCESCTRTSMWYHYAEKYKGIVLELDCSDNLDSAWLGARKIDYVETVPEISTAGGVARMLFMPKEHAIKRLLELCIFTKTPDWKYEQEWRVNFTKRPNETGTYSDYKFDYKELKSIYLGPLVEATVKQEILDLVNTVTPHTDVYETEIALSREFKFKLLYTGSNESS